MMIIIMIIIKLINFWIDNLWFLQFFQFNNGFCLLCTMLKYKIIIAMFHHRFVHQQFSPFFKRITNRTKYAFIWVWVLYMKIAVQNDRYFKNTVISKRPLKPKATKIRWKLALVGLPFSKPQQCYDLYDSFSYSRKHNKLKVYLNSIFYTTDSS